jgi:hypothetical protein
MKIKRLQGCDSVQIFRQLLTFWPKTLQDRLKLAAAHSFRKVSNPSTKIHGVIFHSRDRKICQNCRAHFKIIWATRVMRSQFLSEEDPQMIDVMVKNTVAPEAWHPWFVDPCSRGRHCSKLNSPKIFAALTFDLTSSASTEHFCWWSRKNLVKFSLQKPVVTTCKCATRPCHGSGGYSPASHRGDSSLIPGQSTYDLWWTKWHLGRFSSGVLRFSSVNFIPSLLHYLESKKTDPLFLFIIIIIIIIIIIGLYSKT